MTARIPNIEVGARSGDLEVIEILPDHYNPSGRQYQRVRARCSCGGILDVMANRIRLRKATRCHACAHTDQVKYRIGSRYGKLVIQGFTHDPTGRRIAVCLCDCNRETTIFVGLLERVKTPNCGCTPLPTFAGVGHLSGAFYYRLQQNARARGIPVEVDGTHLWDLYLSQDHRCALSGLPIALNIRGKTTASVDRIDNSKGYVEGNVQWVHKDINRMKGTFNQQTFLQMCLWITDHQDTPMAPRPEAPKPRRRKRPGKRSGWTSRG